MTIDFISSDPHSIGIEVEYQLLDAKSLELVDGIIPLIEFYPDSLCIKPEFVQNTVEVASKVCHSLTELEENMRSLVLGLRTRCQKLGMTICGAGTHPFDKKLATITPLPRYRRMEKAENYYSHRQITFSTHVHIGMISGDEAVKLMHQLKPYLPVLIALSASSPFWRGQDTGYASYRLRILAASRSYGIPPSFTSWDEFCVFFETTQRSAVFNTINDIHWDIRPRPHLGTLEVRVMDSQPTISEAINIASFIRALVAYFRDAPDDMSAPLLSEHLHWWIQKDNHYQASHRGLGANYSKDELGGTILISDLLQNIIPLILPEAIKLKQEHYLMRLKQTVEHGVSYMRQRGAYHQVQSYRQVVSELVSELERDINDTPIAGRKMRQSDNGPLPLE